VLFDCGNAIEGVIDFFLEAGDILDLFSEIVEIPSNRFKFALNTCQLPTEVRDVVLRRHLAFDIGDVVGDRGEAALHGREDGVERCLAFPGRVLCGHMRGVYHGGRLGHERAGGLDNTQHENRKKSARILEVRIMRIGCDVHHGSRQRRDGRSALLTRRRGLGCGSAAARVEAGLISCAVGESQRRDGREGSEQVSSVAADVIIAIAVHCPTRTGKRDLIAGRNHRLCEKNLASGDVQAVTVIGDY
jgi:hypothetical protein